MFRSISPKTPRASIHKPNILNKLNLRRENVLRKLTVFRNEWNAARLSSPLQMPRGLCTRTAERSTHQWMPVTAPSVDNRIGTEVP